MTYIGWLNVILKILSSDIANVLNVSKRTAECFRVMRNVKAYENKLKF